METKLNKDKIIIKRMLDHSPIGYILLDEDYYVHYINEKFLKMRKLNFSDVVGKTCYSISNGGMICKHCAVEKTLRTKKSNKILRRDVLEDGSIRFIEDYAILLPKVEIDNRQFILEMMIDRTTELTIREQSINELDEILTYLLKVLEKKDSYTAMHSNNVRNISVKIAKAMKLSQDEIFNIAIAASLHDLGKLMIPNEILNKQGKLSDQEFEIIKKHPIASWDFVKDLSSFGTVKDIVRHHHEWLNAKGYPDHLSSEEIGVETRIVTIADCYDAINSNRPYHLAAGYEKAIEIMQKELGEHFDPQIFEVFTQLNPDTLLKKEPLVTKKSVSMVGRKVFSSLSDSNQFSPSKVSIEDFKDDILVHSPCGYIIYNESLEVEYANPYFFEYVKNKEESSFEQIINLMPERECIKEIFKDKISRQERFEIMIDGSQKIFDSFIEVYYSSDLNKDLVIEILFDRTEEVLLENKRYDDYRKLMENILKFIITFSKSMDDESILNDLNSLVERLNSII